MQIKFLENRLKYDGSQLAGHFAYRHAGILGDSAVGFIGPCEVALTQMVDLEDVKNRRPIYSPSMLHFILESFSLDLKGGVLFQRICMVKIMEELQKNARVSAIVRRGDDLFSGEKKLSVSIATRSPSSTLIHIGLNVETQGTPVPTVGLMEWSVDPKEFGMQCLEGIQQEYRDILRASYKVRGVGES